MTFLNLFLFRRTFPLLFGFGRGLACLLFVCFGAMLGLNACKNPDVPPQTAAFEQTQQAVIKERAAAIYRKHNTGTTQALRRLGSFNYTAKSDLRRRDE